MKNGGEHAMKVHGMKEEDMIPEMKQKTRGLIRSSYFFESIYIFYFSFF
jgi:hypothetical protein